MSKAYIPKEVSWLSFNERVLQEAENKEVPLMERFNFLGIYSNNLDEYFRVRVATLKRLSLFVNKSKNILGYNPKEALKSVQKIVLAQNARFEKIYLDLPIRIAPFYVVDGGRCRQSRHTARVRRSFDSVEAAIESFSKA